MTQPQTGSRDVRLWLVGLAVAKSATFLILILFFHVRPFVGDNAIYYFVPIAHRINAVGSFNDVLTRDYSSVPPGYPYILAAAYRVAGTVALPVIVFAQFLADLLVAFALVKLGTRFRSARAGTIAAVLWSVFPPAVVISAWISPESFFCVCVIWGLVFISVRDPRTTPLQWMALSGLLFGLATVLRGNTLLLPFVLVGYWIWRRAFTAAIAFTLAFAIPVGAWTLRNWVALGDPIVVSSSFGAAFMQGSDEKLYQNKATEYPALFTGAEAAGLVKPAVETSSNINRWMFRIGLRNYRLRLENEGVFATLGQLTRKLGYMWYLVESGNRRSQLILLLCALAVVPLGLWELWFWLTSANEAVRVPALTVAFWIAIHVLVVPIARYTVPIMPVIVLAACFRVEALWRRIGQSA